MTKLCPEAARNDYHYYFIVKFAQVHSYSDSSIQKTKFKKKDPKSFTQYVSKKILMMVVLYIQPEVQ